MQKRKKLKKMFVVAYGDRQKLCEMFGVSRRSLYDILHFQTNSERAKEVRDYLSKKLHLKPIINYDCL